MEHYIRQNVSNYILKNVYNGSIIEHVFDNKSNGGITMDAYLEFLQKRMKLKIRRSMQICWRKLFSHAVGQGNIGKRRIIERNISRFAY